MKQVQELIQEIEKVGGSVQLKDGGQLRIEAPKGVLTDQIKAELAECKPDILRILKDIQETNKPYIDKHGVLVVPLDSDSKFHWWAGGQSIIETLRELKASDEVFAMYGPEGSA